MKLADVLPSRGEKLTDTILHRKLSSTPYRVWGKVRLADVLTPDPDELTYQESKFRLMSHFDFVVWADFGTKALPLFAVEFDGRQHQTDSQQIRRDGLKNRLCGLAKFGLLRISDDTVNRIEQYTILEYMLDLFLLWQRRESLGYKLDWEMPYFDLMARNPFPPLMDMLKRIDSWLCQALTRHVLGRLYVDAVGKMYSLEHLSKRKYGASNDSERVLSRYQLLRYSGNSMVIRWHGGKCVTHGVEVLAEAFGEADVKWCYPATEDGNYRYMDFSLMPGGPPMLDISSTFLTGIPGVHPPYIAEVLSQYRSVVNFEATLKRMGVHSLTIS